VSIVRIGPKWVARGMMNVFRDAASLENSVTWIHEQSSFMRNRHRTLMREVNEVRTQISPRGSFILGRAGHFLGGKAGAALGQGTAQAYHAIEDSYFFFISRMQMVADVPTWLGAYQKALHEGSDHERAVALADQAVIDSQGSGHIKDLSAAQRGGPFEKMFTQFMSYFQVVYNQGAEALGRTRFNDPFKVAALGMDLLMLYTVPMVLESIIRAALKGEAPDDDEGLALWLMKEQLGYLMNTIVFVREMSGAAQGFQYSGPAGAGAFNAMVRAYTQAMQGEMDAAAIRAFWNLTGIMFHLPSTQVERAVRATIALEEDGAAAAFNALFGGKKAG
jgi:hypothetical protein